jgi:hypothetical protein
MGMHHGNGEHTTSTHVLRSSCILSLLLTSPVLILTTRPTPDYLCACILPIALPSCLYMGIVKYSAKSIPRSR